MHSWFSGGDEEEEEGVEGWRVQPLNQVGALEGTEALSVSAGASCSGG